MIFWFAGWKRWNAELSVSLLFPCLRYFYVQEINTYFIRVKGAKLYRTTILLYKYQNDCFCFCLYVPNDFIIKTVCVCVCV